MPDTKDDFFDNLFEADDDDLDFDGDKNKGDDPGKDPGDKDKKGDDPGKDPKIDDPSLEEQLAEANKQIAGLKSATVQYRQGQASLKKELDALKNKKSKLEEIIEEGLRRKGSQNKSGDDKDDDPYAELKQLNAEIGKDGNVVVPADKLVEILKQQDKKLEDVKKGLSDDEKIRQAKAQYDQHVNDLLGEKEDYPKAYDTLKNAAKGFEVHLRKKLAEKNIDPSKKHITPGMAMDLLSGSDELKAFQKEFPMVDPDILVRAFDSDWDFKRALDQIVDRGLGADNKADGKTDLFSEIKNKPSNFQGTPSQKNVTGDILSRASRLDPDDIMDMSDDTVERLKKEMKRQADEADL